jgi:DNA polymerase-3 subunit alpha
VLKLPLDEADYIAKLVPERPGVTLSKAFKDVPELADLKKKGSELVRKTLAFAETLEGSNRHTGTHACGVIIGPDNLMEHVPLAIAKDSQMMVTQYEGKLVESVGMLKMDFLGLKTLSIIKDAIENIHKRHDILIDIEQIPIDDPRTFELYHRADTIGTFQFESDGMRSYLKELKPTNIEDLIAMNALFRPGPMEFIPTYIRRKHGREKIEYPHPLLEEILKPTYGIMVYQEQIMQVAQVMGGFTLGGADSLRRAIGKKEKEKMEQQRITFVEGAKQKGIPEQKALEVWSIMIEFANYGFNRSHSAAYSVIAFQTAYLKAHYPSEYMAAVLTHNLSEIKKITFFIDECRRQRLDVLGPDINESDLNFTVNARGQIRFGLAAVKGIGEAAVASLIEERNLNGPFKDIIDLTRRVNLRAVNRRSLEALAMAGAFDSFPNTHRAQFFFKEPGDEANFLEKVLRHAAGFQNKQVSAQATLFGDDLTADIPVIKVPDCPEWTMLDKIKFEKDVTGFYMSGHPLDDYRLEMDSLCNISLTELRDDLMKVKARGDLTFGGILTEVTHRITQKGNPMASFTIEDYGDSYRLALFSEDYMKFKHLLVEGTAILVRARILPKFNAESQLEVRPHLLLLLGEAMDKIVREVVITLNLHSLTPALIDQLSHATRRHKGKCRVKIKVIDPEENISVEMPSTKYTVSCSEFIQTLRDLPDISIRLL